MKWKIALVVAIIAGALGGSWIKNLPGLVIIVYQKTSYEMRLWVAVALLLLFFSALLFLFKASKSLLSSMNKAKGWQSGRKWRQARKQTIEGMMAFAEGDWNKSEKAMVNAAKNSDNKLINYLIAAQSAQHQKAAERRDHYLRLADQSEPTAKIAVGLTQAQLQIDNHQYEQALATLNGLNSKSTNHPFILKLLCLTYRKLQDWKAIVELLPQLKKLKVIDDSQLEQLEITSISGWLRSETKKNQLEAVENAWLSLPASCRKNFENVLSYSQSLVSLSQMDEAEKLVRALFKKTPTEEVITTYGNIKSSEPSQQFTFLENWLSKNSKTSEFKTPELKTSEPKISEAIFLALGVTAFDACLWGKARFYLERGLRVAPTAQGHFLMAKTLEKMGDVELANECYQQGLGLVVSTNPARN